MGPRSSEGLRRLWMLDPDVTFLNHGSFGACPRVVFEAATELRAELERAPIRFLIERLDERIDAARQVVSAFLGAHAEDVAFVPNATSGVNTVLRSLKLAAGDELVTTNQAYNACSQALEEVAALARARVVTAAVPFPIASSSAVTEAVLASVTPRTKLVLLDQITSPTALVFPVDEIVRELTSRGVDTLVDAAHAPGMIPLHLDRTGATYTTGNFHKWLCAPKSAAFLHVRRDRQDVVRPLSISHGRNSTRTDRRRFHLEHDWTGTFDPAPYLTVPAAIRFLGDLFPGGISAWMDQNHAAAVAARRKLCEALGVAAASPDEMIGAMASVPIPPGFGGNAPASGSFDPLQEALFKRFRIEIPVFPFPSPPHRLLRVSTPAYVDDADIAHLVDALQTLGRS